MTMFKQPKAGAHHAALRGLFAAIGALSMLMCVGVAHADKATFTLRWSPLRLSVRVYPDGHITGGRTTDVLVSRTQKPSGVFQSCKKVYTLEVAQVTVKDATEHDTTMARKELHPGLCSFSNVRLRVTPFTDSELAQACQTSNHTLHKRAKVIFWDNYYPDRDKYYNQFDKTYGKANVDDYFTFTANVQCGGPQGHPANPRPSAGGTPWRPVVVPNPVGHPVNVPGRPTVTPPNIGQHIACPAHTAARVIEGIDDRHQPYPLSGTPWAPGQAQSLTAYRTRVTHLNNATQLVCYYGESAAQAYFPIQRTMPKTANCQSDGKTGFYCR